jgi:hypothetical protein
MCCFLVLLVLLFYTPYEREVSDLTIPTIELVLAYRDSLTLIFCR